MNFSKSNVFSCLLSAGIFVSALLLPSCRDSGSIASVGENDLFKLNYGNFEDELNLFDLASAGSIETYMTMRDGFFYIANGESKKVMELNTYGDLLGLYYNPESVLNLEFADANVGNSTKKAVSYPFNTLGPIAVDSMKSLYVVDSLPPERQERDDKRRLVLRNVVLRFDADGKFVDYIGQQGPGGTPFPAVRSIYTTASNELVVVCTTNDGFEVFWFGENGFLLYQIPVAESALPKLSGDSENEKESQYSHLSIDNVVPDANMLKLYLKVDCYSKSVDSDLQVVSGIEFSKTVLIPFDIAGGKFEDALEIPSYEYVVSESMGQEIEVIPFSFLGVTENGWFFFIVPTDDGYLVQMVQPDGQRIVKRSISIPHEKNLFHTLSLNSSGIISGLFARKENALVAWWRTDSLIDSFISN
jgi:hypothetical protein